jgi:hypothetical protein
LRKRGAHRPSGSVSALLAASVLSLLSAARAEEQPAPAGPGRELLLRLDDLSLAGGRHVCELYRDGGLRFQDPFEGEGTGQLGPAALARLEKGLAACDLCRLAPRSRPRPASSKRSVSIELRGKRACSFELTWEAWQRKGRGCAARIAEALAPVAKQCPACRWP